MFCEVALPLLYELSPEFCEASLPLSEELSPEADLLRGEGSPDRGVPFKVPFDIPLGVPFALSRFNSQQSAGARVAKTRVTMPAQSAKKAVMRVKK